MVAATGVNSNAAEGTPQEGRSRLSARHRKEVQDGRDNQVWVVIVPEGLVREISGSCFDLCMTADTGLSMGRLRRARRGRARQPTSLLDLPSFCDPPPPGGKMLRGKVNASGTAA
ncbi:hypothetical protein MTO96_050273 [Rhipicephalus appendiculatus]